MTYHGNYQGCRSPKKVVKYCLKSGENFITSDVEFIEKHSKKLTAREIRDL